MKYFNTNLLFFIYLSAFHTHLKLYLDRWKVVKCILNKAIVKWVKEGYTKTDLKQFAEDLMSTYVTIKKIEVNFFFWTNFGEDGNVELNISFTSK